MTGTEVSYNQVSPEKSSARPDAQTLRLRPGMAQNKKNVSEQKQGFSSSKQHTNPIVSKMMMQSCNSSHSDK